MIRFATVSAADEDIEGILSRPWKKVGKWRTVDKGTELGYHTEFKDGMEDKDGLPGFVLMILDNKPNIRLRHELKSRLF